MARVLLLGALLLAAAVAGDSDSDNGLPSQGFNKSDVRRDYTPPCSNPVSKAAVTFPDSIAGRAPLPSGSFSGYIPVDKENESFLFYWFFPPQRAAQNAPLIIFTNGGPGCTSEEGATTELGPYRLFEIKSNPEAATMQFSLNNFAWNQEAALLFVDQPRTVGYSFGPDQSPDTKAAAEDMVTFILGFYKLFPEYATRPLYISGESYAGHYLPMWSDAILDHNEKAGEDEHKIQLSGILIVSGCIDDSIQDTSELKAAYYKAQNLVSGSARSPDMSTVTDYIGYSPNEYDYRLKRVSCSACYSYDYTKWASFFLLPDVKKSLHACGGENAFAGSAGGCISLFYFEQNSDKYDYVGALTRALKADIPIVMMYGEKDTMCHYKGGLAVADAIANKRWPKENKFSTAEFMELRVAGVSLGSIKQYGGLTFMQVENAGHMLPHDAALAAWHGLNIMLGNETDSCQLKKVAASGSSAGDKTAALNVAVIIIVILSVGLGWSLYTQYRNRHHYRPLSAPPVRARYEVNGFDEQPSVMFDGTVVEDLSDDKSNFSIE